MNNFQRTNIQNILNEIMDYGFEVSYEITNNEIESFEARCEIFEEVDFGLEEEEETENGYYYHICIRADGKMIEILLDRENVSDSYEIEYNQIPKISEKLLSKDEIKTIVNQYGKEIESFSLIPHGMSGF